MSVSQQQNFSENVKIYRLDLLAYGYVEGCGLALGNSGTGVSPCNQEQLRGSVILLLDGQDEGRVPLRVSEVGVRPPLQEVLHRGGAVGANGVHQGGHLLPVPGVKVAGSLNKVEQNLQNKFDHFSNLIVETFRFTLPECYPNWLGR